MLSQDNNVEIITSDFLHSAKKKRDGEFAEWPFKITFISEPEYPKNICLKRFRSHRVLAKNISKYLEERKLPDVIYCATPSLAVALAASKYAKKNKVKFIVDIQDLWPEAFKMVFDVPVISKLIFAPMNRTANKIYASADEVVAVSRTYADRAMQVNKKCKIPTIAFLGTKLSVFDSYKNEELVVKKQADEVLMAYIGTLGSSYDLKSVMDAMILLQNDNKIPNLRFIVMGHGPLRESFEQYAKEKNLNVTFTGALPYPKMVSELCTCDFAVNPIRAKSAGSIINKVGDYASAGLAVINTQNCKEYRDLLDEYEAGINCENGNIEELASAIERLYSDAELRQKMGESNRKLAEEKFDRENTYKKICGLI